MIDWALAIAIADSLDTATNGQLIASLRDKLLEELANGADTTGWHDLAANLRARTARGTYLNALKQSLAPAARRFRQQTSGANPSIAIEDRGSFQDEDTLRSELSYTSWPQPQPFGIWLNESRNTIAAYIISRLREKGVLFTDQQVTEAAAIFTQCLITELVEQPAAKDLRDRYQLWLHQENARYIAESNTKYNVSGLRNPYLGLASYKYAQRELYAGRQNQITSTLANIVDVASPAALYFITGASGSGKSSFVQAGLIPALEVYYQTRRRNLAPAIFRPLAHPLLSLADALIQLGLAGGFSSSLLPDISTANGFNQYLRSHTPSNQVNIIIIDQFEELFTLSDPIQRDALLAILEQLDSVTETRTHIICTLRVDYLPALFDHKQLFDIAKSGTDLRAMSPDELKQAMQQPVSHLYPTKQLEPDLLNTLVTQTAVDATYLPLLQVTIEQLWRAGQLTIAAYHRNYQQDLGAALRQHADNVYDLTDYATDCTQRRSNEDQAAILSILLDLVEVADDPRQPDLGRQRPLKELEKRDTRRVQLIDDLATARLISLSKNPDDVIVVDIIHESLLRNWPRLAAAIKEERARLAIRGRFEEALADWKVHERDDTYLLMGVRLAEARALPADDIALAKAEAREFIERSAQHHEEQQRQRQLAEERERLAYARQQIADSYHLAYAARQQLDRDYYDLAMLLGYEAIKRDANESSIKVLSDAVAQTVNLRATLIGHSGPVNIAMFSPDGNYIVTASADNTARLWDNTGQLLTILSGHTAEVSGVVFSPDSKLIVTASADKTARLWDIQGKHLGTLSDHTNIVSRVAFSPDGELILTGSYDGNTHIWERSGKYITTLRGHTSIVTSCEFSPNGEFIPTASYDGTVRLWSKDGQPLMILTNHTNMVNNATFSPDGNYIITASVDYTARLWDSTGQLLATLIGHTGQVISAVFSPNSKLIATASADGTARLWNNSGQPLAILRGHRDKLSSAVFSPDSELIVTASVDGSARLWNSNGWPIASTTGNTGMMNYAVFSPDNRYILTASVDGKARLWDKDSKPIITLIGHTNTICSAVFSNDRKLILTASDDKTARLWDEDGNTQAKFVGHIRTVYSAAFSPDNSRILTASYDTTARLWNKDGNLITALIGHDGSVNNAVFSPDGTLILTTSEDTTARLWDQEGHILHILSGHTGPVYSPTFSPDGKLILTASADNTARLWNREGKLLATLKGHTQTVYIAAFSFDGKQILTASQDTTAQLWNTRGEHIITFSGHRGTVHSAVFSPDDGHILTAATDGTARLWTIDGQQQLVIAADVIDFSADCKWMFVRREGHMVQVIPIFSTDILAIAACRLNRELSEEERRQYDIAVPGFRMNTMQYPPFLSWRPHDEGFVDKDAGHNVSTR